MRYHYLKESGNVQPCAAGTKICPARAKEHYTSKEAAKEAFTNAVKWGVIKRPFMVGDEVRLVGPGWSNPSINLLGAERKVLSVTDDGRAVVDAEEDISIFGRRYVVYADRGKRERFYAAIILPGLDSDFTVAF